MRFPLFIVACLLLLAGTVQSQNQAPVVSDIPDQTILPGSIFQVIHLDDFVTDTDNPDSEIQWVISGNTELLVSIDDNRIATITIPSSGWTGTEGINFMAIDPEQLFDSDRAVFTVTADSLWIDSISTESGQNAVLEIYMKNDDYNKGVQVPLYYTYPDLIIDSVSFVGGRVENKFMKILEYDAAGALVNISAFNFSGETLEPGRGLFASIYITIPPEFPTQLVVFDTIFILPESHLYFVSASNDSYTPQFDPGIIDNTGDVTDANDETSNLLPANFELRQNHPNPFNPTTTISFTLPRRGHIRMEVFNITGQKVRTVIDGNQPAGNHSVVFDGCDEKGNQLASGIYFYRITTENDTETRKMMMLK